MAKLTNVQREELRKILACLETVPVADVDRLPDYSASALDKAVCALSKFIVYN